MKKSEIFFNAILVPIDYFLIVGSALLAYYLRFHPLVLERIPVLYKIDFNLYFKAILIIAPFVLFIFALEGLYSMETTRPKLKEAYKIITASSTALIILVIVFFLNRDFFSSRFIILVAWLSTIVFTAAARIFTKQIQSFLSARYGLGMHRVLLVGKNKISQSIFHHFQDNPKLGYRIVKNVEDFSWEMLQNIKERRGIDEIIQCDPGLSKSKVNMLVRFSDIFKIDYKYIPNLFESHAINVGIRQVAGFPLIELKKTPLDGWGRVLKKAFDLVFSVSFVLIFSPIYLIIALLIKLDSPGPVIYKDYRCGYRKNKFKFYKFRSLEYQLCDGELGTKQGNKLLKKLERDKKINTRNNTPLHKIKNDPRITRVGRFIRRYSLDELPQFFNVLKGDMSVVGYRPHMSYEVDKFNYDQKRMFYIHPGITGLAQISGRSDLNFEEEVRLDIYYMENWSLLMDIIIILKTPFVLFKRRKVD
jgi:exopolysaccharide biosynthesis polyprenyl glycosylphosphotransferase